MLVLLLGCTSGRASAEMASEYHVKAAFLFNFAKFVEWPAVSFKDARDPISICILGKNPFGNTLAEAVKGKDIDGRALVVRVAQDVKETCGCHILFISASERKRVRSALDTVSRHGILTVGETDTFTADGGVINFIIDGEKVHFQVNMPAAEREQLRISSKLLGLAKIVGGR